MFPLVVLETYGSIIKFDKIFHKILHENFIYNRFYLFKTNSSSFFFIFKSISKKFVYGNMPIYEIISEYITNASRVSEYSWNFQTCTTPVNENLYWQGSRTVIREGRCKILKGLCTKSTIYACILHWEYFWSIFFFKHNTILANRKKLSIQWISRIFNRFCNNKNLKEIISRNYSLYLLWIFISIKK